MARADSGGFDLVLELSLDAVSRPLGPLVATPIPDATLPRLGMFELKLHTQFALTRLQMVPECAVQTTISSAGSSVTWPDLTWGGITVIKGGAAPLSVDVTLTASPAASGTKLSLTFPADAVTVKLAPGTLEAIPGIHEWLSFVGTVFGDAARETERAALYSRVEDVLAGAGNAVLPDSVPLGSLPSPPVRSIQLARGGDDELRVLMTIGGTPGVPAEITRSGIRRSPAGAPLGIGAVIVGNHCLLRDILAPALTKGLGLDASGFCATAPGLWTGNKALPDGATVADIRPSMTSVLSGIDAAGALTTTLHFEGQHSTGAFGLEGSLTLSLTVTPTGADDARELNISLGTSVVNGLDIWVAWWVYAIGVFGGTPLLVLATALTDAFAGGALAGAIDGAVRAALGPATLSLPLPGAPIPQIGLSMLQPDSALPTATIGTISFPLPLPESDVILTIG